ncbi:unnamed protein product [Lactuca saligna]|uniref:Uncharacterized protein n=1 Tax=Lactuca saligna TaxID=75948 RepID=A0AA35VEA6_LACSI|nr:unnamed protein product [Lactuca saligna]
MSVGPSAFGLMKQKMGGKFVFEGKFPLIRFGIFAEDSDQSDSENQSNPTETDDVVISTSEPEIKEVRDSPITIVAGEHSRLHNVEVETQFEEGNEDLHEDVDFLKEIDFTGTSDYLPSSIELNHDDDELGPFSGFDSRCFKKVNEVAQPATKTGEEVNALKIFLSSSKHMAVSSGQRDLISEISPSDSTVSTSAPFLSESTQQQTSQSPLKGSQSDSRLGVPSGKGISFRKKHPGDDKTSVSLLREEIGILNQELIEKSILLEQHTSYIEELKERDEMKSKQIKDLQKNLGSITTFYFSLKNILYDAFGDKVNALFQQPHGIEDPLMAPTQSTRDDFPVDPPPPRTTTIVIQFEKEPENSRPLITIKQGKRTVTAS